MLSITVAIQLAEGDQPTDREQAVLNALSTGSTQGHQLATAHVDVKPEAEPQAEATTDKAEPEAEKPAPAKRAPRKAPVKKAAQPEPTPAPEPEADDAEDDVSADEEDTDAEAPAVLENGPTREEAAKLASEMVDAGKRDAVKKALSDVGARRVSTLEGDQIAEFIAILEG